MFPWRCEWPINFRIYNGNAFHSKLNAFHSNYHSGLDTRLLLTIYLLQIVNNCHAKRSTYLDMNKFLQNMY